MSQFTEQQAARIVETAIGLGVPPSGNCDLCRGRENACPTHTGTAIAFDLRQAGLLV